MLKIVLSLDLNIPLKFGDQGLLENNPSPQNLEGKINDRSFTTQNEQMNSVNSQR